jgi:hypothetical protein
MGGSCGVVLEAMRAYYCMLPAAGSTAVSRVTGDLLVRAHHRVTNRSQMRTEALRVPGTFPALKTLILYNNRIMNPPSTTQVFRQWCLRSN